MRRRTYSIVIGGIVLGLVAIGLIGGSAHANPGGCTDGGPAGVIGTDVTPSGSPVYLGAEVFPGPSHYGGGVCYHVPGVAGGIVYTWTTTSVDPTADRTVATIVRCEYVAGLVTLGCWLDVTTDTTDDANWNTNGKATSATVAGSLGGANVGSTGAFVGFPGTSLNLPADGDTTTTVGADSGTGTCVWVHGTPTCPPVVTIARATLTDGDVTIPGTHPNSGGCITVPGNPCVTTAPDGFGVSVLKGDPTNDTVTATVAGVTVSEDLGGCVGFNAGPGC